MRTAAVILARLDSSRLPRKQLLHIGDQSILEHVANACRAAGVDKVVLATTARGLDDDLAVAGEALGLAVLRHDGPVDDVAGRFHAAMASQNADVAFRVNGDSPCVRPALMSLAMSRWQSSGADVVTNVLRRRWPFGLSVELISRAAMAKLIMAGLSKLESEHVTQGFYSRQDVFRIEELDGGPADGVGVQMAVDTPTDLARCRFMHDRLSATWLAAPVEDLVAAASAFETRGNA